MTPSSRRSGEGTWSRIQQVEHVHVTSPPREPPPARATPVWCAHAGHRVPADGDPSRRAMRRGRPVLTGRGEHLDPSADGAAERQSVGGRAAGTDRGAARRLVPRGVVGRRTDPPRSADGGGRGCRPGAQRRGRGWSDPAPDPSGTVLAVPSDARTLLDVLDRYAEAQPKRVNLRLLSEHGVEDHAS
jgi:hypothetical protein